MVGFSRGAYTARALGGLICSVGLLDAKKLNGLRDKDLAYRYGLSAWQMYRIKAGQPTRLVERWILGEAEEIPQGALIEEVLIRAIGVWDTVGSLGIPRYSDERRLDVFRFADNKLNQEVERGFHAVSIDEKRSDFEPTLWDHREDGSIEQVWFTGAHSDVGGGYPRNESGLSDHGLTWMTDRLSDVGLIVDPYGAYIPADATAVVHEPWNTAIWKALPRSRRSLPKNIKFHFSVPKWLGDNPEYGRGAISACLTGQTLPPEAIVTDSRNR